MILRIILWSIVLVMVLRFIFRFLFPVMQMTKMTQERLRQMQDQMNQMQQKTDDSYKVKAKPKDKEGDYIEYEEVK